MQTAINMGRPIITEADLPETPKLTADNIIHTWVGLKPPAVVQFTAALGVSGSVSQTNKGFEVSWGGVDSDISTIDENVHQLRVWAKGKKKEIAFNVSQGTINGTCYEKPFHGGYLVHGRKLLVGFWID